MISNLKRTILLLLLLAIGGPSRGVALTPVPSGLAAGEGEALQLRYEKLAKQKAAINDRVERLVGTKVVVGSEKEKQYVLEQQDIQTAKKRYQAEAAAYEHDLEMAVLLSKPVPDLTGDPAAVRLSELRLREVEGRMRRLQRAIDILGSTNPEWDKEWDLVYQDMRRDSAQLSWVALDLLTLDLAELNKLAKEADIAKAGSVLQHELWQKIPLQQEQFHRAAQTANGEELAVLLQCIASVDQLEKAREAKKLAEAMGRLRETLVLLHELHEKKTPEMTAQGRDEAAYEGSLLFGQLAIIFVKGVGEKANLGGTVVARSMEANLLFSLILQEEQQHRVLAAASYDRHQKKLELMARLEELEGEKSRLDYVRERSQPREKSGGAR